MADMTPMMQQYMNIKKDYPDTLLFFRLGDFYEMFFEDAKIASKELELILTGRDCGQEERAPMCGVPFHSVDSYLSRLVAKGYKVAICEQMEDPALAKGIVKRDVSRVLTPGTVIESNMLDDSKNNYLACIYNNENYFGISFTDISTGAVHITTVKGDNREDSVINELGKFSPSEIILNAKAAACHRIKVYFDQKSDVLKQVLDDEYFLEDESAVSIEKSLGKAISSLNFAEDITAVCTLGATVRYISEVQKSDLKNILDIDYYTDTGFMKINFSSRRNLELIETMRNREKKGTLLWVLDKTKCSMGKRLLRTWVENPLTDYSAIVKRHRAVDELFNNKMLVDEIRNQLTDINDIERIMSRVVYGTANCKELRTLANTIQKIPSIISLLENCQCNYLKDIYTLIDPLLDIYEFIDASIVDEPPFTVREGGMIKDGYHEELDSLRALESDSFSYINGLLAKQQEETGIKKIKIGYNKVFGYYIEVPNAYKEMVPDYYIRKQTLSNCERFITEELKDFESKILGAKERIVRIEYELYTQIRDEIAKHYSRVIKTAGAIAQLDVLSSLALVAKTNNYVCPEMHNNDKIEIAEGRHPVVELMLGGMPFVPNDTVLDCDDYRCAIITGPNMAGKSTYMRQVALIVLMAQIGSFVPARSAKLCICDSIFTRVGASDDLASGQSTFMVEMSEVATILNEATSKSLIIFDEIGRGTSTFDGMSIARAVLEYTVDRRKIGAKTLFATHYHELTEIENQIDGIKNYNIAVKKRGDDITFLRRIIRGCADGSYGVEVAKLAGVPTSVVKRAKTILNNLEDNNCNISATKAVKDRNVFSRNEQVTFVENSNSELINEIKTLDVNTLTPIEALTKLYEIVRKAKEI